MMEAVDNAQTEFFKCWVSRK